MRETLGRCEEKIVGRRSDSYWSQRVILTGRGQTQVGGNIVVTIDARWSTAGYLGRMRLARFVVRHAFDAAVMAVAALVQAEIWAIPVPGPKLAIVPGMLLATLPLLLRRRFPFAAPACVFAALAAMTFAEAEATTSSPTLLIALLLAFWSVGAHAEQRQAVAGLAIGFAAIVVVIERDPGVGYADTSGHFLVAAGIWLTAVALRRRARRATELEGRAARLVSEREEQERVAVAAERRRIARDLHDVIAHSVSVMIVQAGAARLLLAEAPDRAVGPLLAVEETGRQALGEMRRLLGVLRGREFQAALSPQPGLAELEALLAQARAVGLPVELTVEGEAGALPKGVELAAYRIVQEALTNARKHAGPAQAHVVVRYGKEELELEIRDDGRASPDGNSGGHGLVGMRERVALYGGELRAGSREGGGYAVRALLPLDASKDVQRHGRDDADRPASQPTRGAADLEEGVSGGDRAADRGLLLRRYGFDTLVVILAVVSEVEIWLGSVPGPKLITVPAVLFYTLPLLLRRRFPFAAPALAFAVQAAITFADEEVGSVTTGLAALLLTFWAAGSHRSRSLAVAGFAIGIASLVIIGEQDVRLQDVPVEAVQSGNFMFVAAAVWLAAFAFQRRTRHTAELEARATHLERDREVRAGIAVAEERTRIARELHDVIAHCVSVMTVQSGAARLLLEEDPKRAVEPLLAVEDTGRQALAEMRRLLEILRRDMVETGLVPQPGLSDLPALVERCEAAGVPVELKVAGEPEALAPGVDLAAYRVVQEALTNAVKHAGPARVWVTVHYDRHALELEIADDGQAAPKNGAHGQGLVGMRERVALYGGDLEAGHRSGRGYAVHARFPLEQP
jgi:signal transduction histidine kinase